MPEKEWDSTIDLGYLVPLYRGVAEGVVDYGVDLVAKRSARRIPKRTGRTAATQATARNGTRGAVGFGGSKAVALHENLQDRHKGGRTAKYLEGPLVESTETIRRRAVAEFRRITGG